MTIHYTRPFHVTLAKSCQGLGKALARSDWQALARGVARHQQTAPFFTTEVAKAIKKECEQLVSTKFPSLMRKKSKMDLLQFSWEAVVSELQTRAPLLLAVLSATAESTGPRNHQRLQAACLPFIGMAAAILLKCRNKHMCEVQHIMSLVLNAGHSSSQVCTQPSPLEYVNVILWTIMM